MRRRVRTRLLDGLTGRERAAEHHPVIRQFRVVNSDDDRSVEASVLVKGAHLDELLYLQPA